MTVYHLTKVGIPNTCTQCATPCAVEWYAEHADAALSGRGYCARCVGAENHVPAPQAQPEAETPYITSSKRKPRKGDA